MEGRKEGRKGNQKSSSTFTAEVIGNNFLG